ncbi:SUMF1/EgtB/PvdO family nonheme iron enzyme [Citrobacter werkmanii]|uniref:formylglycine-generating enzyme family protein n=1 Tax=Citrobacter werkmanii TaxID=67827 RepID=UPI001901D6F3|nr:SUMF1/EgtB/PvdO family nonheme iron enzyme [Citrobacter werkmanii]MBJ9294367.1 SUMF1/EgtB/PvdO family nonheme iron enzyme [Citrobacter werkmanii]
MYSHHFCKCGIVLFLFIGGCDNAAKLKTHTPQEQAQIQKYISRIKSNYIFVKGGSFWMGDFCKKMRNDGPYCSPERDTKPLHEVELSSFSIAAYKVTHEDYDFYLKMSGLPPQRFEKEYANEMLAAMTYFKKSPAMVTWTEASHYCTWLKKETGLPFSLPTEAQWEYAARNRGQNVLVATNTGDWQADESTGYGKNYATDEDRREVEKNTGKDSVFVHFPVDKYPPTSLGLYGMADNGYEWVQDWYDPDYYKTSPRLDPQGPLSPVVKDMDTGQYRKVQRGGDHPDPTGDVGLTFFRGYDIKDKSYPDGSTMRCVVNSADVVK